MLNRKNKILLVLYLPPPYGGGEIRSLNVFNFYNDRKNIKIVKITRKRGNKGSQGKINLKNILYSITFICRIIFRILTYLPDKIYLSLPKDFPSFFRNSLIIIFSKLFRTKVYGELAGTSFMFMDGKERNKYNYGKYIFGKIDSVRLLGNNITGYAKDIGIKNIRVFDNGIDIPVEYIVKDDVIFDNVLKMLYVGSLEAIKGIYNLIDALILCKKNNLNFKFSFVGEWVHNNEKDEILQIIKENGLTELINFYGLKINNSKWEIYSHNSLLVHPTFWDGQPISILEAMGLGLSIISTNIGAIPDTIKNEENGIILKENTPEILYETIKMLDSDRKMLKKMSVNNIEEYRKRFTSKIFLQNFQNWIEE